jgi:hypothetical protein
VKLYKSQPKVIEKKGDDDLAQKVVVIAADGLPEVETTVVGVSLISVDQCR